MGVQQRERIHSARHWEGEIWELLLEKGVKC